MRSLLLVCIVIATPTAALADDRGAGRSVPAPLAPPIIDADVRIDVAVDIDAKSEAEINARAEEDDAPVPPPPSLSTGTRTHRATLGLSVTAARGATFGDRRGIAGFGAALMIHPLDGYRAEVAIELQHDRHDGGDRADYRIGYGLYIYIGGRRVAPYVVIPMGLNVVDLRGHDVLAQGYVGIGGGVAVSLGRHWTLMTDARALTREETGDDDEPQVLGEEALAEVRGSFIHYF